MEIFPFGLLKTDEKHYPFIRLYTQTSGIIKFTIAPTSTETAAPIAP